MAENESHVTLVCMYARSVPASPAMNEPIANATTFVRTTSIPAAAATRSFVRTASIFEPSRLVRSFATPSATSTSTARTRKQNSSRGSAVPAPTRRSIPRNDGPATSLPLLGTKSLLRNQNASSATASASVTTARGRPRTRIAGSPTTTPIAIAPSAASSGAIGKGTPQLVVSGERRKPPAPARVSWANETWPAYPVTTTSESASTPKTRLVSSASRHEPCISRSATTAAPALDTVGRRSARGRGARPSVRCTTAPRDGSGRARTTRTSRTRTSGTSSGRPEPGNQV